MSQTHEAQKSWSFELELSREQYVQRLLETFRQTPTTTGRVRPADRHLADRLFERGIPLAIVQAAFSLAAARRIFRHPKATPLQPIRSLHYFLPLLEEIRSEPIDPEYIRYIQWKLDRRP